MTTPAMVSVIVPCRNEERFIARCLDSIAATAYPRDRLEVLVVDGRSDDRTRSIVAGYVSRHPFIRILDNPRRIPPSALNVGIRAARGDILIRMDAHAMYPANYIGDLVAALQQTGADNVGGALITVPARQTPTARAIAIALSHPFGVGNSHFRVGVRQSRWVETVAFFCCRRETFERVGLFDEEALDEDSEFNARLSRHGRGVLLVPSVVCYYYARESLREAARLSFRYGYSKPTLARKLGRVTTLRQLVPPAFVLGLAATALLSAWLRPAAVLFTAAVVVYLLATLGVSLVAGRRAGLRSSARLALVFPTLHLSYGLGFLKCVAELALGSNRRAGPTEAPLSR